MTAAHACFEELLAIANTCKCNSIELRNDLATAPIRDEKSARLACEAAQSQGIQIAALAELVSFNQYSDETRLEANKLARHAKACGSPGIVLIPTNDGSNPDSAKRKAMLLEALTELQPVLEEHDIYGLIEPLGFSSSTLRFKAEVVECIEANNLGNRFKLIHDTFHHYLAQESDYFGEYTSIVHVSGVVDKTIKPSQMQDQHRVLVNQHDRLNNLQQLESLVAAGFSGPVSMEAFAPEVQASPNLTEQLKDSYEFIHSGLATMVA